MKTEYATTDAAQLVGCGRIMLLAVQVMLQQSYVSKSYGTNSPRIGRLGALLCVVVCGAIAYVLAMLHPQFLSVKTTVDSQQKVTGIT